MRTESRQETSKLRSVICERCGREFECRTGAGCWCEAEPFRLAVPTDGSDCFCPECLRNAADEQK
jgi:hypothetical protein